MTRRFDLSLLNEFIYLVLLATREEKPLESELKNIKRQFLEKELTEWSKVSASELLKLSRSLQENLVEGLKEAGFTVARVKAELKSKGLIGIGSGAFKAVFEVGLNLDPVTGLPYYPASSVKGLVRDAFEKEYLPKLEGDYKKIETIEEVLFGTTESEEFGIGLLRFFDAYPIGCPHYVKGCAIFTGAVITPHYYKGGEVVDTELDAMPVPVIHIAIAPRLVYEFLIAVNEAELERARRTNKVFDEFVKKHILNDEKNTSMITKAVLKKFLVILMVELSKGGFARGSKGYNVFEPTCSRMLCENAKFFSISIE